MYKRQAPHNPLYSRDVKLSGGDGSEQGAPSCLNPNMTFVLPAGFSLAEKAGDDMQSGFREGASGEICMDKPSVQQGQPRDLVDDVEPEPQVRIRS